MPENWNQLDEKTQKLYDQTLRFLSFRPRTTSEVKSFLQKHHATEKQKKIILFKLEKLDFINDINFAKWWVEQRQTFKPKGLRVIRNELRLKGISQEIIEKVFGEKDERKNSEINLARKAAEKKLKLYKDLPKNEFYVKMGRYLAGRGFDWEVIKTVIDELLKKE